MNQTEAALLKLLDGALHQKTVSFDQEPDWNAVFAEANMQTVAAMAGSALPQTVSGRDRACWEDAKYSQIASYVRYMTAQDELCRLFKARGIPVIILKGSAAAVYYPQPFLRAMGDIDLYTSPEYFQQAQELLLENGYTRIRHDNGRNSALIKDGVECELHHRFSRDMDVDPYILESLPSPVEATLDAYSFPMLPAPENGLILLEHLRAHLREGVGLRQVLDWMMYVERRLDDEFWDSCFSAIAKEMKLDVLAVTVTRLCQMYLGLRGEISWCSGADEALCGVLIENLFQSGNFGRKHGSGRRVERVATIIRREGLLRSLQKTGLNNWEAAAKHPWLRPFAWLYQLFRYAGQFFAANRGKRVVDDLRRSKERLDMLEKLQIK